MPDPQDTREQIQKNLPRRMRKQVLAEPQRAAMDEHSIITAAVAEDRYQVRGDKIGRHVRAADLVDHRPRGHAKNAPLQVDEHEIARRWTRKPPRRPAEK